MSLHPQSHMSGPDPLPYFKEACKLPLGRIHPRSPKQVATSALAFYKISVKGASRRVQTSVILVTTGTAVVPSTAPRDLTSDQMPFDRTTGKCRKKTISMVRIVSKSKSGTKRMLTNRRTESAAKMAFNSTVEELLHW